MAENHDEHADSSQQWEDQTVYGPSTVIAALDRIEDLLEAARAVPLCFGNGEPSGGSRPSRSSS